MKKPVKIIFSVVLSVAMVLSLALTAYGASSLTFDFTVTVKKGKVFDENGDLYTGWYIKNRHKYYAESGHGSCDRLGPGSSSVSPWMV